MRACCLLFEALPAPDGRGKTTDVMKNDTPFLNIESGICTSQRLHGRSHFCPLSAPSLEAAKSGVRAKNVLRLFHGDACCRRADALFSFRGVIQLVKLVKSKETRQVFLSKLCTSKREQGGGRVPRTTGPPCTMSQFLTRAP